MSSELTTIPNVGPAVARKLRRLGITHSDDLRGCDPEELFERLCALDGRRHDPCLLDTFAAAVSFATGDPARPWWEFSRERKARGGERKVRSRERKARGGEPEARAPGSERKAQAGG